MLAKTFWIVNALLLLGTGLVHGVASSNGTIITADAHGHSANGVTSNPSTVRPAGSTSKLTAASANSPTTVRQIESITKVTSATTKATVTTPALRTAAATLRSNVTSSTTKDPRATTVGAARSSSAPTTVRLTANSNGSRGAVANISEGTARFAVTTAATQKTVIPSRAIMANATTLATAGAVTTYATDLASNLAINVTALPTSTSFGDDSLTTVLTPTEGIDANSSNLQCVAVACIDLCKYGYSVNKFGCPTCKCECPKTVSCPPSLCELEFVVDEYKCITCQCKNGAGPKSYLQLPVLLLSLLSAFSTLN